jgi:hypothetical protein
MVENYITLPADGIGKKIRTQNETISGNDVHEQIIHNLPDLLTKKIEYDASNNPIYVGEAAPGTAVTTAGWRIKLITYDASNNPTDVQWADGNTNFDKIWNNRSGGTYTYS